MGSLEECLSFWDSLKNYGFEGDLVGGAYKGKVEVHDLDLVCLIKDFESNRDIIESTKKSSSFNVPIELYYCSSDMYSGLKKALRATTYENIHNKLMKGLRFSKVKL